jgi:hypothetical protein
MISLRAFHTSMLSSPYSDKIEYLADRSWTMLYSAKAGELEIKMRLTLYFSAFRTAPVRHEHP